MDPVRLELKRVADLSPLMVWITEADGNCIYINQQWYDFTGQPKRPGMPENAISYDGPIDLIASSREIAEAISAIVRQ